MKAKILITGDREDKMVILKALGNPYVNLENHEWVVKGEGDTIALRAKLQRAYMSLEKEFGDDEDYGDLFTMPYCDKVIFGLAEAEIVEEKNG
jgi:hypothetical protein